MEFFTSDSHFNHKNVISYCSRPFVTLDGQADVEAMNNALVERWNERVGPEDTVFHLGDFSLQGPGTIRRFRSMLNGRIVLIRGNHDRSPLAMQGCGFVFLCGHVHEKWKRRGSIINVGVDQWDFRPVTLYELLPAVMADFARG